MSREQTFGLGLTRRPLDRLVAEGRGGGSSQGCTWCTTSHHLAGLAWGGVLIGGPESRLGGRSAGFLYGLNPEPARIEVMIPWSSASAEPRPLAVRARTPRDPLEAIRRRAASAHSGGHGPRPHPADHGGRRGDRPRHPSHPNPPHQPRAPPPLSPGRSRLTHRRLLANVLGDVAAGAQSALEIEYLRDVERAHGLPDGERQQPSGRTWQDVRYRRFSTIVELDGRLGHEGIGPLP